MAEWAINLASDVDTAQRFRLALGALFPDKSALKQASGILDNGGTVTRAGGMSVSVAPFRAFVQGNGGTQGGYLVCLDTAKTLTIADGGAQTRIDLIVGRVRDHAFDGGGTTSFSVEVIQGVGGGGVPALPAGAVALGQVTVPLGVTAGTGGLPIDPTSTLTRRRLVPDGGTIPVATNYDRDNELSPRPGMTVWNIALGEEQIYTGTEWKTLARPGHITRAGSSPITLSPGDIGSIPHGGTTAPIAVAARVQGPNPRLVYIRGTDPGSFVFVIWDLTTHAEVGGTFTVYWEATW